MTFPDQTSSLIFEKLGKKMSILYVRTSLSSVEGSARSNYIVLIAQHSAQLDGQLFLTAEIVAEKSSKTDLS